MLQRGDLRNYQNRGVDFFKSIKTPGLFLDMGLGKTIITLTAVTDLIKERKVNRVLLVAPLRPAQGVWRQEARKWAHTRHLTFKMLTGNEQKRLMSMKSSAQIHIINVDNLRWLLYVLKSMQRRHGWPYDMLIIDESSMFKAPGRKRFSTLRHHLRKFDRRAILTGTPAPKGLIDIWSQIYILDLGQRLGEQVKRYRERFFSPSGYMGYGYELDDGAEPKILSLISPLILSMRAEDWLELPPEINQTLWVDLPPTARKLYDQMEKEMFVELESGSTEAVSAASVSSKCWQIANGALFLDKPNGTRTWQAVHDAKLEMLQEIVEGTGDNLLVTYWFKPDLARLRSMFPKAPCVADAKTERQLNALQNSWNRGDHRIMFIHPQSGGHGLNLQGGGNTLIMFSLLWGREAWAQVRQRMGAARQYGLRDNVQYKYIAARNTVDEAMLETQRVRHVNERRMIRILRDYRDVREILA